MGESAENYSFREGVLTVSTGTSNPYTAAYVRNVRAQVVYGWLDVGPTMGGQYSYHLTGKIATLSMEIGFTPDRTLRKIFESATAVHINVSHNSVGGSAGYLFYSGRLDTVNLPEQEGATIPYSLTYHAHEWSAY